MTPGIPQPPNPQMPAALILPVSGARYLTGFWKRALALLIDLVVLMLALAYPAYRWFSFFSTHEIWSLALGFAVTYPYAIILDSGMGGGHTIGKRLLGIQVVDQTGDPVSLWRSAIRVLILATPLYVQDISFPGFLNVLIGLWGFAVIYLAIFNRRTRQSLHDVVARTYVIDAHSWQARPISAAGHDSPMPATAPIVTSERVWPGHWRILGGIACAAALIVAAMTLRWMPKGPLSDLSKIQQSIAASGMVRSASVNIGKTWTAGSTTEYLSVTVVPSETRYSDAQEANRVAGITLNTMPKTWGVNTLSVIILHRASFGIFHFDYSRRYQHSPEEWRSVIGDSQARSGTSST